MNPLQKSIIVTIGQLLPVNIYKQITDSLEGNTSFSACRTLADMNTSSLYFYITLILNMQFPKCAIFFHQFRQDIRKYHQDNEMSANISK